MSKITSLQAREILDSRGNPTVEVSIELEKGIKAKASVPSGASTGLHEAVELRDGDKKRFNGAGVLKAVKNVNDLIGKAVVGKSFDQRSLDDAMLKLDGTENKAKLGANAILGVSMAFARASAMEKGIELYEYIGSLGAAAGAPRKGFSLPQPFLNIINGGKHADSGLDIQEFMLAPSGKTFAEKIQVGAEIISALKKLLLKKGYSVGIGDEGGFAPKLKSNEEAFALIVEAAEIAGYAKDAFRIGIDAASSSFFVEGEKGIAGKPDQAGTYNLRVGGEAKRFNSDEMVGWYSELVNKYPIVSIEDGLSEDDWEGFSALTAKIGDKVTVVGDDLTVTNIKRIKTAVEKKSINSVLIKLNQIGSVSETVDAIVMTQKQGWVPFISHRSGETEDTFISDLSVGLGCESIKAGSLARGERICKYNRLLEIEMKLEKAGA